MVGVPIGAEAGVLAELAKLGTDVVFVARDDVTMERVHRVMRFMAPEVRCVTLPAWDCLPYDRVSPRPEIIGARLAALMALLDGKNSRDSCLDHCFCGPSAPHASGEACGYNTSFGCGRPHRAN